MLCPKLSFTFKQGSKKRGKHVSEDGGREGWGRGQLVSEDVGREGERDGERGRESGGGRNTYFWVWERG